MLKKNSKIFVAGHKGMVGSAILRLLKKRKFTCVEIVDRKKLDLTDQKKVFEYFKKKKFDYVIIAAAKVGGIHANKEYKADFIYQNLAIQNNLIHASYKNKIKKLIFLGSSCIYPKFSIQPIKENYLLDGKLEETNEAYAIAKIAGIKMCQSYNHQYGTNYISLMPTNLYGKNDNYDLKNSHVLPALIKKIHNLKQSPNQSLVIWGNGKAKREFLFVDDLADACLKVLQKKCKYDLYNVGCGKDYSIKNLAVKIMKLLNVKANIIYDRSKPNGTPRKLLNIERMKEFKWKPKTNLDKGIIIAYKDFLKKN